MLRAAGLVLVLSHPAPAEEAGWSGRYGGLSLGTSGPSAGFFVGAMTERGPAVLGLEVEAAPSDDAVAVTGRIGRGVGGTLLYGLAALGSEEGQGGLMLGAGATRRLGGVRLGGELRHMLGHGEDDGETRVGGRISLEF